MILDLVLLAILLLLKVIVSLLPSSTGVPSDVSTSITNIFSSAHSFDGILPVYELIVVLKYVLVFEAGVLLWKLINWVLNKTRGSGG